MKQFAKSRVISAIAVALMLGATGAATAGSTPANLTVTGAITNPISCTVAPAASLDASIALTNDTTTSYTRQATLSVTCTSGASYSINTPSQYMPLALGSNTIYASITHSGMHLNDGVAKTGTGASEAIVLDVTIIKDVGSVSFNRATDTGSISGTLPISINY